MLKICENYATEHGLQFSTDPNPRKCKTKCITFVHDNKKLRPMMLCRNPLPWVEDGKHIGHCIQNVSNGMIYDMKVKRARYIGKNNELLQGFAFAHPLTRILTNQIFNCHFTGAPLWDLFCYDFNKIENTYSTSVKKMLSIPRETHKYFIEPLSEQTHIRAVLMKRFLSFIEHLKNSPKKLPLNLFRIFKNDVSSITGSNLRNIMLNVGKTNIEDLNPTDADSFVYCPVESENEWKIEIAKELLEVQSGCLQLEHFSFKEVQEMLSFICI